MLQKGKVLFIGWNWCLQLLTSMKSTEEDLKIWKEWGEEKKKGSCRGFLANFQKVPKVRDLQTDISYATALSNLQLLLKPMAFQLEYHFPKNQLSCKVLSKCQVLLFCLSPAVPVSSLN